MADVQVPHSAEAAEQVFHRYPVPGEGLHRLWWFARFVAIVPFSSWRGGRALQRHVDDQVPAIWPADFAGKRALIIGTGPSLDRVGPAFFDDFDVLVYINFALRRATFDRPEYFFTMDPGPSRQYIDAYGTEAFRRLGPDRCVIAPIYFDFWHLMTEQGRAMFTWLRPDATVWQTERFKSVPFPVVLRHYPRQPDWRDYRLPQLGREIPILKPTSALTAVMFAAMCGSRDIGLIGCDFSDSRAASMGNVQTALAAGTFNSAREEFMAMQASFGTQGIRLTNHSWLC